MLNNKHKKITDLDQVFLTPANSTHRQYEALRAFFVDKLPSAQAASRFGYTPAVGASQGLRMEQGIGNSLLPCGKSSLPLPNPWASLNPWEVRTNPW